MNRPFIRSAAVLLLAGFASSALCAQPALPTRTSSATAKPFNVLFIIIDDHGPMLHDVFQPSQVHTPNLQRLANRGTWFTRGYVDAPACCPSRTAFLTGVHATKSGVYYNGQAYRRNSAAIAKVDNLPQHFLKHNYLTAGYGKIAHNRFLEDDVNAFSPGYYKMMNRRGGCDVHRRRVIEADPSGNGAKNVVGRLDVGRVARRLGSRRSEETPAGY